MIFLALLLLPFSVHAQNLAPNSADIELQGNVTGTLTIGGQGCWSGYTWHTIYGGCRRRQLEQHTETSACPVGWTGQRTRTNTRYNYIAQGSNHVASEPWMYGEWDYSNCWQPVEPPTIANSVVVAESPGGGVGGMANVKLYVMMQTATQKLWCYWKGNNYNPGPFDMQSNGYTDPAATAWCMPRSDGSMHFGHSYMNSWIVRVRPVTNNRVNFEYTSAQMLTDCSCFDGGDSRQQFIRSTYATLP